MKRLGWIVFANLLLMCSGAGALKAAQVAPPTAPTGFSGVAPSTTSIQWSWGASTGSTIITYEIHAVPETSPPTIIASGLSSTSYLETGLSENTPYSRNVYAVGTDIVTKSPPSNTARRYTLIHTATTGDYTVKSTADTVIDIEVVPPPNPTGDQTGVQIFRNVPTAKQITPFSPVYSALDTGLQPDTEYCYNIEFQNGDGIASGPSPSSQCAKTTKKKSCTFDVKIVTKYRTPDILLDQKEISTYVFPDSPPDPNQESGFNHFELTQKGTRIHEALKMRRGSRQYLFVTTPIPDKFRDPGAPSSQTTMTITHTGDDAPLIEFNASGELEERSKGRRGACISLGTCGHWAQASAGTAQGKDLLTYSVPEVGKPFFAETNDGNKHSFVIFLGGDLGRFFGGTDLEIMFPDQDDSGPIATGRSQFGETSTPAKFTFVTSTDVAGAIEGGTFSTTRCSGHTNTHHTMILTGTTPDCNISVTFTNDGTAADVKINDDLGSRNFTLTAPDATKTVDPTFPQWKGGGGPWGKK